MSPAAPRVLFYVQHLLGIGHLKRAALICRALAAAGLDTTLVSGGMPVPGLDIGGARLHQLPPLRSADMTFSALLDEAGRPVDEAWRTARRDRLLAVYRNLQPDALVLEMYPFGRRQMRFELIPLLETAWAGAPRPLILSSLRDILSKAPVPKRAAWIEAQVREFFDAVLVHADPRFVTLEASFPEAAGFADALVYTGYVADRAQIAAPGNAATERRGVVVSAGGGAVGAALIEAALAARPLSALKAAPWTLLTGPNLPTAQLDALARQCPENVTLSRAHPRFLELLSGARLSISQGGYNTVADLLRTGPRAVIVPFAAEGEAEQTMRARLLETAGVVAMLEEKALTPQSLCEAIDRALAAEKGPRDFEVDLGGAEASAAWIARALGERQQAAGRPS
ncbi:MAG: glycosyltransferase [Kiloniellales bacterium]|nr:glycosyltransferase [Kiloniellales bacterium]